MTCMGQRPNSQTAPSRERAQPPATTAAAPATGTRAAVPGNGVADVNATAEKTMAPMPAQLSTDIHRGRQSAEPRGNEGQQASDGQFPGPGREREEGPGLVGPSQPDREGQGTDRQERHRHDDRREQRLAPCAARSGAFAWVGATRPGRPPTRSAGHTR